MMRAAGGRGQPPGARLRRRSIGEQIASLAHAARAGAASTRRSVGNAAADGVARAAGWLRPMRRIVTPTPLIANAASAGVSVIIPSREGKALLDAQLAGIAGDLAGEFSEIIVVDNGSSDGTAAWLRQQWPQVTLEVTPEPLSFASAVNRGIRRAQFSHICLLNNDMRIEPGFFAALLRPFAQIPDLFCTTAQIRFAARVRREETGKAVMAQDRPEDFPIRCDEPVAGEDGTWVLYGSGGCSVYDAAKLRALGGVDEAYAPAYVEDLDLGYRGWLRGWPSVYVAEAVVEHRHRATTARYYTEEQLAAILETNYLKFLTRAVASPRVFRRLWRQALVRLRRRAASDPAALAALRNAARLALAGGPAPAPDGREESLLAMTDGSLACFPGPLRSEGAPILVTARGWDAARQASLSAGNAVLLVQVERLEAPPRDVLSGCAEIIEARSEPAFQAAIAWTRRKWKIGA